MDVSRFNPHAMPDQQIRLLSTGRDRLIDAVADALTDGEGVRQHVLVTAPRGFGKSFFVRAVELAIRDKGDRARVCILPEEQRNVTTPSGLLREITRVIKNAPAASVPGQFLDDEPDAWENAEFELEKALAARREGENDKRLTIVAIENFDGLAATVFADPADQSNLRAFLAESKDLSVLATGLTARFDQDYEQRLFHAFAKFELPPWTEDDHVLYFQRRARIDGRDADALDVGKIRALARFTGGSPRMAVALADLLLENDPLSAAALLDKLVDELTPYYQNLIDQMPARTKTLFDALIRLHEPCSQSDLAERVGTTQNRIAQHFSWLRERHLVIGKKRTGGRDFLYQVADRLFVQYYRKRYLLHEDYTPLAGMAELLDGFFSAEENRRQAVALLEDGRADEAGEFVRAYLRTAGGDLGAWAQKAHNQPAMRALAESDNGDHRAAIVTFRKAAALAEAQSDETGRALILGQLGVSAAKIGNYSVAIEAHQEALAIWRRRGESETEAWVLAQLAKDFRGALQFDDALHYSKLALTIWREKGPDDRIASLWGEVAENLRRSGRAHDAIDAYSNAINLWKSVGDRRAEAWVLGGLGLARQDAGDFREAIKSHVEAIDILRSLESRDFLINRDFSIALNFGWLAISFRRIHQYEKALEKDEAALTLWRSLNEGRREVKTLSSIAVNFIGLKEFKKALNTSQAAFRKAQKENYQSQIIWSAAQLCYLHIVEEDVSAIWSYLDERPVADMRRLLETVLTQSGAALGQVEARAGRPAAFELGMSIIEGLRERRGLLPVDDTVTYLLSGLLETASAMPLLRDLSDESSSIDAGLSEPRRQALDLASRFIEAGEDVAIIEQADPDIGETVRAILDRVERKKKKSAEG